MERTSETVRFREDFYRLAGLERGLDSQLQQAEKPDLKLDRAEDEVRLLSSDLRWKNNDIRRITSSRNHYADRSREFEA